MTLTLNVLGWLIFLVGIGASIALHEIGHLVPAKRFGVKVTQYMVGFGSTVWSRTKGETEYGIKAIPLGGYIRMIGMFPPARNADGTPGDERMLRQTSSGPIAALVDDARQTSAMEIAPEDVDRVFYKLPVHRKLIVMLGGPTMNLAIAAVLFTIALVGIGAPTATTQVGAVPECLPVAADEQADVPTTECTAGPAPAAAAGLQVGDVVTSFNGTQVSDWEQLSPLIRDADPGPVALVVDRDGRSVTLNAELVTAPRPVFAQDGSIASVEERTFFGMAPSFELVNQPLTAVPSTMWNLSLQAGRAIITLPARMFDLARSTFGSAERDPNGLVGVVGVGRITGEVVAAEGIEVELKALQILGLLAGLNLFLFLFNLVPLLPLDGGHVAGALWEGTRRRWAKLRRRPDPGYVDVARALPLAYGVSMLLIVMAGLLIYADLVDPIRLGL